MAVDEQICFVLKCSWAVQWQDFSRVKALPWCVSFCFGLRRNITSQRKNASIKGCFALYQSVVLFLAKFVFEVCKR